MNFNEKKQQPPYYAVIFSSQRTEGVNGYGKMAQAMEELASIQQGFLGVESARDSELGITVSYWETLDDIKRWKENSTHKVAQEKGKEEWYKNYNVRVCKVEWRKQFRKNAAVDHSSEREVQSYLRTKKN